MNQLKTVLLLSTLSGICLLFGQLIGGYEGLVGAFIISLLINGFVYFFSDKIVLKLYKAKPMNQEQYPEIYSMIQDLRTTMKLPMPKLWIIETPVANAFATGRNPGHASIAVTTGILQILEEHELRGVLAHELSHIYNRDILIGTLAATIAATIGHLANMVQNAIIWGGYSGNRKKNDHNALVAFILALIIPLVATLIQLAISRSREYMADESGAGACQDPLALASALEKIHERTRSTHFDNTDTARAATAHLFIVRPFRGTSLLNLLSTHPPVEERVKRLKKIFEKQHLS